MPASRGSSQPRSPSWHAGSLPSEPPGKPLFILFLGKKRIFLSTCYEPGAVLYSLLILICLIFTVTLGVGVMLLKLYVHYMLLKQYVQSQGARSGRGL